MATKLNYLSEFYEKEISNGIVPELYIDKELLTKENICFKHNIRKVYSINEDLFYEDDRNKTDLQEFCLELNNKNQDNEDWSIEIKQNSFVVMVNSILLLSSYQWNTITDEYPPKCLVCDIITQDPKTHIKMGDHVTNLEKHKPLKKFNLHITRMIGDQYHCAVCNEVYEKNNNIHLDSERHLERMLYATNRATVGVYDFDINNDSSVNNDENHNDVKKDTVSTSESGFDSDGFYDFNNFNNNKSTLPSYASVVKQSIAETPTSFIEHVIGNKTFTIASDAYHMILRQNGKNLFYCMLCIQYDDVNNSSDHCTSEDHMKKLKQCEIMDIHEEHFIRKDFHAPMRRIEVKKYLVPWFTADIKSVKKQRNSGNSPPMKIMLPARSCPPQMWIFFIHKLWNWFKHEYGWKREHAFKVTNKFYHCGTCNNLLLTGAVEQHLELHEKKHENKTNKNRDEEYKHDDEDNDISDQGNEQEIKINEISDQGNVQQIINESSGQGNVQQIKINKNSGLEKLQQIKINENSGQGNVQQIKINENMNRGNVVFEKNQNWAQGAQVNVFPTAPPINNIHPHLYKDIIIDRFNCNIRVSLMSYNLILRRQFDFFCPLCNFYCSDMSVHLNDVRHIVCLKNIPFQPYFGINLVRMLNQYAHCAICNVLVNASVIHLHTTSQPHLFYLNKALNPTNYNIAMNQTNIVNISSVDAKSTGVKMHPSENVQEIPSNSSESLNQASATETKVKSELAETELDPNNLEYDIEDDYDVLKEFIYLKIKQTRVKVSYASYNTLVHSGDGTRYCFICSYKITSSLRGHIESKSHMNRMKKCKFITNYEKDLLRQVKLTYHCCICNVLVKKSDIKNHLMWPVHKENTHFVKFRHRASEDNIINAEFQTKDTSFNEKEPQIQIVFKIMSGKKTANNIGGMVINMPNKENRGKIFNITWDAWHGITRYEHGVQCNICCDFFVNIDNHLEEDSHKKLVSIPIEKQYLPACIRKITEEKLNCVTCNMFFSNKYKNVSQHLSGKKHLGIYEDVLQTAFTDVLLT